MRYRNRTDAAQQLAAALAAYRGRRPVVLAIPRGAVPMGRVLADALDGELDVALVRKLGAPGNPEHAVGAIDESGWTWIEPYAKQAGADAQWLEKEETRQLELLRVRRACYSAAKPPIEVRGRVVILVDDGLATGATMRAALHAVRVRSPAWLVCALPVAAASSLHALRGLADEFVCLQVREDLQAVGEHYDEFEPVSDDEVIEQLRRARGELANP